jgi:hypothetical protein
MVEIVNNIILGLKNFPLCSFKGKFFSLNGIDCYINFASVTLVLLSNKASQLIFLNLQFVMFVHC